MKWRAHPLLAAAGVCAVCVIAIAVFWDWNWLRPLVEARASDALGRDVRIENFDVALGRRTQITVDGITIANPPDFGDAPPLGTVDRLAVTLDLPALLHGRVVLTSVEIDRPRGDLGSNAAGKRNWEFANAGNAGTESAGPPFEIGELAITDGRIHFADTKLRSDFTVTVRTDPRTNAGASLVAEVRGTYKAQPIHARFRGGSLISLRDPSKPYPVTLDVAHGETRLDLDGTVDAPLKFAGANLRLSLRGKDLSDLQPLIGIPLAPTAPYDLKGKLAYADGKIRFDDFAGKVGESDLSGDFAVDPGKDRPRVTAKLHSRRVVLADLGGFIGAAPGKDEEQDLSAAQKAEHAREAASPTLLPDVPLSVPDIRSADFHVDYRGDRIEGRSMPLDDLAASLSIEGGRITLSPLTFGIGKGEIASNIALDARQTPIHTEADVDFREVDLHRIMRSTRIFEGAGTIGGRAFVEGNGNSLAEMLGHGNGKLKLFMTGGDMSALLVDLAGLDIGNSVLSALGLPQRTQVRCMVSDFALTKGTLRTNTLFLDTTEANVIGDGTVDLGAETIDYRIATDPKHFSIGSVAAPILVRGRLKSPSIAPDPAALAARAGPSAALGVLLTPLAALLPTIQLGLGKDSDCTASVARVERAAEALPKLRGRKGGHPK
jgi:uncharacterized protein involved in outer membrane biogenesis